MCIFVLIGGLEKTGVIASLSTLLAIVLGKNIVLGSLILLFGVGAISRLVPNIPLVIAVVPLLKNYVVVAGLAGSEILAPGFSGQFPDGVLPPILRHDVWRDIGRKCNNSRCIIQSSRRWNCPTIWPTDRIPSLS